ncbi:signal recognition particle subunit SRP72-like [Hydractinia symbiolongicarpus]|uniref:signal recognition particle subunit SRP72-like n=1 Tax=Hydractinia symbiolongicarpus TaxID=13093 RepID=UPI00254C577E|nr:signal recognition particle subunit SRP72-like [Hydractinia symbiolongicarpus]
MAAKEEISTAQLFAEVLKSFKDGDYSLAQKSANKILKLLPNDVDALKCKIVCLIQQSCFQEAHDVITSNEKKGLLQMTFEKAYCLYRLNRLHEAAKILNGLENPGLKENELLAQVNYRLEDYSSCLELYRSLIKNSADDYGDEREANMAAVIAAAKMWKKENIGSSNIRTDTYELCYNYACLLIAQGNLEKAETVLKEAEGFCRQSLEADEDTTEEDVEEELGVIRAQLAYIRQLQGKTNDAVTLYNQVLKSKPPDIALVAVISNNIISINKDRDLFDSKKRLKSICVDGLPHKLTSVQQQAVEINKCLLYMYTNQMEKCKKCLSNLKQTASDKNKTALLEAAVQLRDKHEEQALSHLEGLISSGINSNDVVLTLCQLHMSKGKHEKALDTLKRLDDTVKYKPAIVSLRVSLYNILGNQSEALACLEEAVEYGRKNPNKVQKEHVVTFMRENSNLKLTTGDMESAVKMLEMLRKEDPTEITTLAKIVAAYSKFDLQKAEEHSVDLPELSTALEEKELDLDVLEMTEMIGSFRFSKKTLKQSLEEGESKDDVIIKQKKRKRKKGKLPKNYNPDVDPDPERWLPRWERSTFKHKKAKRGTNTIGKGTQGSVASEQQASPKPNSVSSPKPGITSTSPHNSPGGANVVPPRQQKPGAKSKSKKKKKGGW